MDLRAAKQRAQKLRDEINDLRYRYHVLDDPAVTDEVYDSLTQELKAIEEQYPALLTSDSPTQRIGGEAVDKFRKVRHGSPMLSLGDAFSEAEMREWEERLQRLEPDRRWTYFCELKFDGLAISLVYERGVLRTAATRGDAAAGAIRQLDPKISASRPLEWYAYQLVTDLGQSTHEEEHLICQMLGFKVHKESLAAKNLQEVFGFHDGVRKKREKLPFEVDGVVAQVNENPIKERFGVVGKAPRGAIAFKFPGKKATTSVEDIIVQVGRTGKLTPVALLKPVQVGGVTVGRATLHNLDEIERLGVKIGDTVVVKRAGDVIPDVEEVLIRLRTGKERIFHMPKTCPVCGGVVKRTEGEVDFYCMNPKCFVKTRRGIRHFTSRTAFDIEGAGPKIIEKFVEKSADNIHNAIQNSKEITLSRFIYALGIKHVGEQTAFDLAGHFGALDKLRRASLEELNAIENVGDVVAKSISEYFADRQNQKFVDRLLEKGIKIKSPIASRQSQKLKGLKIVVTGTLASMSREEAKRAVLENGGDWVSSVSKNTALVVVGENPGSKLTTAEKLEVKIIDEKEFLRLLK